MLHGWGDTAATFADLAGRLQAAHRVVRLDLPGFGGTELPPANWRIADYAGFVQAFVQKLGLKSLEVIIAHSFGGRVTIKALATGLIAPRRIILMGTAGVRHSRSLRNQAFKAAAKAGKAVTSLPGLSQLRSKLRRSLYQAAGSTDYLTAGPMRQVFVNTINEDLQDNAGHISVPALLIWGQNDTETPLGDGQILSNKIPHATLKVVPGAGHFVHHDAADAVYAYIQEFLK
jgi:pimeloyl-ACP methyl ester carboxylesterase